MWCVQRRTAHRSAYIYRPMLPPMPPPMLAPLPTRLRVHREGSRYVEEVAGERRAHIQEARAHAAAHPAPASPRVPFATPWAKARGDLRAPRRVSHEKVRTPPRISERVIN